MSLATRHSHRRKRGGAGLRARVGVSVNFHKGWGRCGCWLSAHHSAWYRKQSFLEAPFPVISPAPEFLLGGFHGFASVRWSFFSRYIKNNRLTPDMPRKGLRSSSTVCTLLQSRNHYSSGIWMPYSSLSGVFCDSCPLLRTFSNFSNTITKN